MARALRALPPRRLFTDILYTCKQLYEEGSKILYSNTLKCLICSPKDSYWYKDNFPSWGQIGGGTEVGHLPRAILYEISRIHIEIHLLYLEPYGNLLTVQECARALVKEIRTKAPHWTDISIELVHDQPVEKRCIDHFESPDEVLNSFLYVRNRSKVSIKGASESFTSELTSLMTSDALCVDLDLKCDAVEEHVQENIPDEDELSEDDDDDEDFKNWTRRKVWRVFSHLERARDENDTDEFYKVRSLLMLFVALYEKRKRSDVFKFDPAGREPDDWLQIKKPLVLSEESEEAAEALERMIHS